MEIFLGLFLSFVALCLLVSMLVQARSGKVDPFSVRNFFLLGFIVFQLTSATITLTSGYYDALRCDNYAKTGLIYTFIGMTFLFLFLTFYSWGVPAKNLAARVKSRYGPIGPYAMLLMAALFLVGAVFWRFVMNEVPVVNVLALIVTTGLAGAAAGLAMWTWAPRWSNPFVAVVAVIIIAGALSIGVFQDFGRRNALSILIACLWGGHHGYWKHVGVRRAAAQVVPLAAGALLFVAAFTAGRKDALTDKNLGFTESIARLGRGDLGKGFMDMASGQAAGACSMWLIETRPQPFPYDTFHTAKYFFGHPVPRIIWPGKPIGLGTMMTTQGNVQGRSKEFSFGPGIIGHIANDNPWLCLVPYAFLLAFMMRFMDQIIRLNPANPFVIIPLGVALGEILGLPRGEAGFFLSRAVIMTAAAWIGISVCGMVMRMLGVVLPPAHELPHDDYAEHDPAEPHDPHDPHGIIDPELAAAYTDSDSERAA